MPAVRRSLFYRGARGVMGRTREACFVFRIPPIKPAIFPALYSPAPGNERVVREPREEEGYM